MWKPTHISNENWPTAAPLELCWHLQRCDLGMPSECMLNWHNYIQTMTISSANKSRVLSRWASTFPLCSYTTWVAYKPYLLASGWVWPVGGPSRVQSAGADCVMPLGWLHPSKGKAGSFLISLLDRTQSSQVSVIMPFCGPTESKGGNNSTVTVMGVLYYPLWFPFTLTTPSQFIKPSQIVIIWGCYRFFW